MTWKGRTGYVLAWVAAGAAIWFYVDRRDVVERFRAYQENDLEVRKAAEKAAALDEEVFTTRERVENLHSNPLEIESAIRRAKGLVRPGEIVYRIEQDQNADSPGGRGNVENATPATGSGNVQDRASGSQ